MFLQSLHSRPGLGSIMVSQAYIKKVYTYSGINPEIFTPILLLFAHT